MVSWGHRNVVLNKYVSARNFYHLFYISFKNLLTNQTLGYLCYVPELQGHEMICVRDMRTYWYRSENSIDICHARTRTVIATIFTCHRLFSYFLQDSSYQVQGDDKIAKDDKTAFNSFAAPVCGILCRFLSHWNSEYVWWLRLAKRMRRLIKGIHCNLFSWNRDLHWLFKLQSICWGSKNRRVSFFKLCI